MAAAIGLKVMRNNNAGGGETAAESPTPMSEETATAIAAESATPAGAPSEAAPVSTPLGGGVSTAVAAGTAKSAPTPYDLSPRPSPARSKPTPVIDDEVTDFTANTPKPAKTKVASIPKATPKGGNAIDEMPVEGPPAQILFGKGAA